MGALVDEARLRIVLGLVRPGGDQVVVDGRTALVAAVRGLPFQGLEDGFLAAQVLAEDGFAHFLVRVVGTAADRLAIDCCRRIGAADGRCEDLLDQAGAGAAGGSRLGVLLDLVQRKQALGLDGLDDGALGHAVTAADLGAVGHLGRLAVTGVADIADQRLAEDQRIADIVDVALILEQLEVPRAVGRVAVHDAADQLVVLDDQLLVHAAVRVVEDDFLGVLAAHVVAGREQVDASDLELGRGHRAGVAADAVAGQVVGRHLGLLEQRRNQAVGDAAMADALADGVHLRIVGLHGVVHHDAAVAVDAGFFGQRVVRADTGGHHDEVGRNLHAALEADSGDAAGFALDQRFGLGFEQELEALVLQRLLQHLAGHFVELAFEQPGTDMHHGDIHAAQLQAVGGFQPEQAATDDDRVLVMCCGIDHLVGILDVAVADDAGQVIAGDRQHERGRAGGDQQAVVIFLGAIFGDDLAIDAVDGLDLLAGMQGDLVFGIPVEFVENDVLDAHFAGQYGREEDTVVVRVGFGTEDGDVVVIRFDLQQLFDGADTGHAVTDQDETGFAHVKAPTLRAPGGANSFQRMTSLPSDRPRWRLIRCFVPFFAISMPTSQATDLIKIFRNQSQDIAPLRCISCHLGAGHSFQFPPTSSPVASTATIALAWLRSSA